MRIAWKNKKNLKPAVILNKVESFRTVSKEGVSFALLELDSMLVPLLSMLKFPPDVPYIDKSTLVWKTLSSISTELTPQEFETKINKIFGAGKATKEQNYHVLTSISLYPNGLKERISINGTTIKLLNSDFPKKYESRAEAIIRAKIPVDPTPSNYTRVIVTVRARTPDTAVTSALRTIDLYRAALCLFCNNRMEIWGKEWIPINVIRLGGVHSVHFSNGKIATEEVWFDPSYIEAPIYSPKDSAHIQTQVSIILRRIFKLKYAARFPDALLRYVRALDERDQNNALIKLWGALEVITNEETANYNQTVQRCSFIFGEHEYHTQVLESLREYRNQSVHAGDQSGDAKVHCFHLQYYFSHLFWFLLSNAQKFASLDEAYRFLDLPREKEKLRRQKRIIEKALRYIP